MEQILQEKNIESLVHFTNVENLESILEKGLLTRKSLEDENIAFEQNDEKRLDGELDSISLSVEHPNYKMFYRLRCDYPEKSWVVLKIKASILKNNNAMFYVENAASSSVASITVEDRMKKEMFNKMFEDFNGVERSALDIPPKYPTNPQAEILFLDSISQNDITHIAFGNMNDFTMYKQIVNDMYPHIDCQSDDEMFTYRKDYESWR